MYLTSDKAIAVCWTLTNLLNLQRYFLDWRYCFYGIIVNAKDYRETAHGY